MMSLSAKQEEIVRQLYRLTKGWFWTRGKYNEMWRLLILLAHLDGFRGDGPAPSEREWRHGISILLLKGGDGGAVTMIDLARRNGGTALYETAARVLLDEGSARSLDIVDELLKRARPHEAAAVRTEIARKQHSR